MNGPETADGTLIIIVCRAKHLPNRRKLDKQSPYVLMRIGTEAKKTTAAFRAGQTPEWTQEIRFQLTRDRRPLLKLDVLDETKNDPTPIGDTEIDCAAVFQDQAHFNDGKYILDGWYDLKSSGRDAGKIYLEITFYPSAPLLPPKVPSPTLDKELPAMPDEFTRLDPVQRRTVGEVFEQKAADFGGSRASDPGEEVFVNGSPKKEGRFKKLRERFQSKEPLRNLFTHEKQKLPVLDEPSTVPPLQSYEQLDRVVSSDDEIDRTYDSPPPPPPPHSAKTSPKRAGRKPPPGLASAVPEFDKLNLSNTLVPFSAETMGLDDDEMPTQVYQMGLPVRPLTHKQPRETKEHRMNPNEIDPKFYAPTPSEHLAKSFRLQNGNVTSKDVNTEYNTEHSGYLGAGQWLSDKRFLPSVFQRVNDENEGEMNKPPVPPKVPQGLTNMEYYVLEKDSYLKDINGRRL
ncbi:hypothetical protein C7M61_005134 [Candidozyma pseudohaemuli]|uniref:C2 domain-containing protein n=1 Tax=Candidozyma pseudohaemuli TaxID=418784 RepID=A0A2P7YCU8_9ASCO|nr:hypothetical protein C7M61_005134 [[Candida] pseudohaemulonii]PSK33790.1 hypothetical protein C7M61_005134 [[Candida] pseudohaemulonii]